MSKGVVKKGKVGEGNQIVIENANKSSLHPWQLPPRRHLQSGQIFLVLRPATKRNIRSKIREGIGEFSTVWSIFKNIQDAQWNYLSPQVVGYSKCLCYFGLGFDPYVSFGIKNYNSSKAWMNMNYFEEIIKWFYKIRTKKQKVRIIIMLIESLSGHKLDQPAPEVCVNGL